MWVFHQNWKQLFSQNIFWNWKHMINKLSKEEIVLSRDSKELFVQQFVQVFDQNWKHVEVQNQRTSTPADFTVLWLGCQKQPLGVFYKKSCSYKYCNIYTKHLWPQQRCFPVNIAKFWRLPMSKNICDRLLFDCYMVHCYMGLMVQGLNCMMVSGFMVQVTGIVFCF